MPLFLLSECVYNRSEGDQPQRSSMMKVVGISGERQCGLEAKPVPKAAGEMVVVKILAAPMCTEYKLYTSGYLTDCLGHEAAGEVAEVAQQGRVRVGDRVVVMPQYPCGRCPLCL